jgi:uncharacterized RDD family membrane protein YckC
VAAGPGRSAFGEYAGFGIRLVSYILDGILYGLVMIPFMIAGIAMLAVAYDDCETISDEIVCPAGAPDGGMVAGAIVAFAVGVVLVLFLYLRALARSGQTWARRILNIKVVRTDNGLAPGWGKAIGRSLVERFISPILFGLGFLWMLWDDQNQCWQDKAAGTYVVRC